jgi:hypothetical protein
MVVTPDSSARRYGFRTDRGDYSDLQHDGCIELNITGSYINDMGVH